MARPRSWSEPNLDEFRVFYLKHGRKETAKHFGIPATSVTRLTEKLGLPYSKKKNILESRPDFGAALLSRYRMEGPEVLGNEFGLKPSTVRYVAERVGLRFERGKVLPSGRG